MEYTIPIQPLEYPTYLEISPKILTDYDNSMYSIKNIVVISQTPPENYAYIPSYISAGPQTHYAIYKILPNNKLHLIYNALLIVYDGCSAYLIDKNMRQVLKNNKLNHNEVDDIMQNKYQYITPK